MYVVCRFTIENSICSPHPQHLWVEFSVFDGCEPTYTRKAGILVAATSRVVEEGILILPTTRSQAKVIKELLIVSIKRRGRACPTVF
jgi:hypothetical protein